MQMSLELLISFLRRIVTDGSLGKLYLNSLTILIPGSVESFYVQLRESRRLLFPTLFHCVTARRFLPQRQTRSLCRFKTVTESLLLALQLR